MAFYDEKSSEVIEKLDTDVKVGLSDAEVKSRLEKYGQNKLREKKKKTTMQRFLDQFKDVMIIILLVAAAVSAAAVAT